MKGNFVLLMALNVSDLGFQNAKDQNTEISSGNVLERRTGRRQSSSCTVAKPLDGHEFG